jgi:predicted transcriptional regulator
MSPRAAWRLEALGFEDVYDYVAGKTDWFACGQPREGTSAEVPWTGDLVREGPTCNERDRVADVREYVSRGGFDLCVVLNERRVVSGLLREDALAKDPDAVAGEVMELGPRTIRPSRPVEKLLGARSSQGVNTWIVTSSHGVFLGLVTRDDAERALEASKRARETSEAGTACSEG